MMKQLYGVMCHLLPIYSENFQQTKINFTVSHFIIKFNESDSLSQQFSSI